jgi:tetratricopeptide (TPR) repeat protein
LKDANPTVILADGEHSLRKALVKILRDLGIKKIAEVSNGTEAWSLLRRQGGDLILASWEMDEMNGLGLLKVVRADAEFATVPIVLVSKDMTKGQVIEAGEAGVSDIVLLPLSASTLKSKIEPLLGKKKDPAFDLADRYFREGLELMRQERWEDALDSFQKVIDTHENAEVYYNMGYIKTAQGRYEEAIQFFRRATMINQDCARAFEKMGECYVKLGREKLAKQSLEKAADIYMEKQMDDNAELVLKQVLEINPNTINVYNSLGILYRRQGKYQKAIAQYKKAMKVNPDSENVLYNLGRIYYDTKQYDEAKRIMKRAVDLNPDFKEAQDMLTALEMGETPD